MQVFILAAKAKTDMSAWFNLFADLDPLGNPDAVGRTSEQQGEKIGIWNATVSSSMAYS